MVMMRRKQDAFKEDTGNVMRLRYALPGDVPADFLLQFTIRSALSGVTPTGDPLYSCRVTPIDYLVCSALLSLAMLQSTVFCTLAVGIPTYYLSGVTPTTMM